MRVAFFSPLPPRAAGSPIIRSLIENLKPLVELEVFPVRSSPSIRRASIALYHVGNNGHHGFRV
jgi:hypothetical protein